MLGETWFSLKDAEILEMQMNSTACTIMNMKFLMGNQMLVNIEWKFIILVDPAANYIDASHLSHLCASADSTSRHFCYRKCLLFEEW